MERPMRHIPCGVVAFILCLGGVASGETVTLATYNIEHFQDNFRAHELSKKLPRDIQDPVLKELLASEREGDDEDNWEIAQVITHPNFNPDILVIEEGCTQDNLDYFNKRWLNNAYATAVVFATNTDRDQHLAMLLKPGFRLLAKRDQYHLEKDTAANGRGDRLFARGPAFCLIETPAGYRFWVGVTHQKSKRIDFGKEQADAIYAANPGVPRAQVEQKIAAEKLRLARDAAAWRNREAKRTHEIMRELEKAGPDDVILLGDMNDELGEDEAEKQAGGDAIAALVGPASDGFVLATRPLAEKGEFSFGGYFRTEFRNLIDHAVLTKGMKDQVQSVGVFKEGLTPVASDHYPVYVKVRSDEPGRTTRVPPR
jgi:endonuclease/exonuclease/phosphatase family metal-dependent hydrolase